MLYEPAEWHRPISKVISETEKIIHTIFLLDFCAVYPSVHDNHIAEHDWKLLILLSIL